MRQNLMAGGCYLMLGLFAIFVLIPIGVDEPSNVEYTQLAPAYWPRIICIGLVVLGAAILLRSVLQLRGGIQLDGDEPSGEDSRLWRASIVIVIGFILYAVLEWLGFVLAPIVTLIVLMVFAGERKPQIILPVAIGVPLALYIFFTKAASIPIPTGILESILVGG